MNISIIIATHKRYQMPEDSIYLPVQSGSSIYPNLGYQNDNTGDNISRKNKSYNIMCVMYWAWKNIDSEFIGIVHYRRHFTIKKFKRSINDVLNRSEVESILKETEIILSPKRYYPFLTIKQHYIYTKGGYVEIHRRDIQVLREVLDELHGGYIPSFDIVMKRNYYHSGHLLIMSKKYYNEYSEFIFTVGDEVEARLKDERPDLTRYIASLTELLIDVWIIKNDYKFKEVDLLEFEKPNFFKKLVLFIRRTITGYYPGTIKYLE
jgi:hypothetical protein